MIPLIIDGEKKQLPTRWSEVTFKKFVELSGQNDLVDQIAALTDFPASTLRTHTFSGGLDYLFKHTQFLKEWPLLEKKPAKCGPFKLGEHIETMDQLNAITEQFVLMRDAKAMKEKLNHIRNTAAIYCQGVGDTFDKEKALYLAETFNDLPCEEVLSTGHYYQTKALSIVDQRPQADYQTKVKFRESPSFFKRLWHSLS